MGSRSRLLNSAKQLKSALKLLHILSLSNDAITRNGKKADVSIKTAIFSSRLCEDIDMSLDGILICTLMEIMETF